MTANPKRNSLKWITISISAVLFMALLVFASDFQEEPHGTPKPPIMIVELDRKHESVTIENTTDDEKELSGWQLGSVNGDQRFNFPDGTILRPHERLTIASGGGTGDLFWTDDEIWLDSESDRAELYNREGEIVYDYDRGVIERSGSATDEDSNQEAIDEFDELYMKAREIYAWFDVGTLDSAGPGIENEGTIYYEVAGLISSYQELVELMESVFAHDIVEDLLSRNAYIDIDGVLYGIQADRGTDWTKGEESGQPIMESDTDIIYRVQVEIIDGQGNVTGHESHDFPLHLYEDGMWRFEEFHMVR